MTGPTMEHAEWDDRINAIRPGRRRFMLSTGACLVLNFPHLVKAHGIGIVNPPVSLPLETPVIRHDGVRMPLRSIVQDHRTLLQLMFTGCSEVCPLQGALFAEVQDRFGGSRRGKNRLLSLSIDPMDDARSLSTWLSRFGAQQNWAAAVPASTCIDVIRAALQTGRESTRDHSSQAYFLDESGRLIWRSEDFPSSEVLVAIAQRNHWLS